MRTHLPIPPLRHIDLPKRDFDHFLGVQTSHFVPIYLFVVVKNQLVASKDRST